MRRHLTAFVTTGLLLALLAGTLVVSVMTPTRAPAHPADTLTPVARNATEYQLYGRILPDPHGCKPEGTLNTSPFAKGKWCATDFLQHEGMVHALKFMDRKFPRFAKHYVLHKDFECSGRKATDDRGCRAFRSAGLPVQMDDKGEQFVRERRALHMIRITDESVPNDKKKYFVFPLSIHGIERAGVEGGTRAAEDLVTWAACEAQEAPEFVDCTNEDNKASPGNGHPLLEATPEKSIGAGEALKKSVIYFMYANPDGWLRGDHFVDLQPGAHFYQRYNGNGVDLNRDWPEQGFTFRPYTPWSEPESKSFGKVLQAIGPKDRKGDPKWTGGIDLHGQLIDRAFSFTLIGGSQRPFDKNQRVLQTVKGAWADAEERLAWSPLIKSNDQPRDDPRLYGVQWGTIWDTIDYTVTGALGNWIDSPMGLNADGIDNEMSMSHLINCGVGTCYIQDAEQLHVDGNKSLIYSMINYSLKRERTVFDTQRRVAYLHNKGVVSSPTKRWVRPPKYTKLPPQKDIENARFGAADDYVYNFTVKGPSDGVYNGGIAVTLTCAGAPVDDCAFDEAVLERKESKEPDPQTNSDWEIVNSYFNQSPIYFQAGKALHANLPLPGRYRIRINPFVEAPATGDYDADINFTREKGWPDPGQIGYRATNMKFWSQLKKFASPGLEKITARELTEGSFWKKRYDTIVVTNKVYADLSDELKRWVAKFDGNLVLTDKAIKMLPEMGLVDRDAVDVTKEYAGYVNFATRQDDETYDDPLARKINQPGAAEGQSGDERHRRQTYEPVPLGFSIQTPDDRDAYHSPVWFVKAGAWDGISGGKSRAVATTEDTSQVSYGEIKRKGGTIRILGAVLPMPSDKFDHPFGLASYAVTYSGYQLLQNTLTPGTPDAKGQ
jgi:hypothetical protein